MYVSHSASRLLRRSGAPRTIGSGLGGGPPPPGIDHSLSDDDINKLLPGVKIIAYPELAKYTHIEDAFDAEGRVVILFETESKTVGHWIALHATPDGGIEFFDAYGLRPDSEKRWLSKSKLVELHEDEPLLMDLLRDAEARGMPVTFNNTHFQSNSPSVQTCGRHCVVRLMGKGRSLPDYTVWIKNQPGTPDDVVTRITNAHLQHHSGVLSGGGIVEDAPNGDIGINDDDRRILTALALLNPSDRQKFYEKERYDRMKPGANVDWPNTLKVWDIVKEATGKLFKDTGTSTILYRFTPISGGPISETNTSMFREMDIGSGEFLSIFANSKRLSGAPIPQKIVVQGVEVPLHLVDDVKLQALKHKLIPRLLGDLTGIAVYIKNHFDNAAFVLIVFKKTPFQLQAIKVISKSPLEPQNDGLSADVPAGYWDVSGGLLVLDKTTKGLGTRLMDATKALAHAYHVEDVSIQAVPGAHGFYKKQDMKTTLGPQELEETAIKDIHLMERKMGIKRGRRYIGLGRKRRRVV